MNVAVTHTIKKHFTVNIFPNKTEYLVTGLEFGTSYHMYLEAVFEDIIDGTNTKTLKSWILIAMTYGVGPDNRAFHTLYYYLVLLLLTNQRTFVIIAVCGTLLCQ